MTCRSQLRTRMQSSGGRSKGCLQGDSFGTRVRQGAGAGDRSGTLFSLTCLVFHFHLGYHTCSYVFSSSSGYVIRIQLYFIITLGFYLPFAIFSPLRFHLSHLIPAASRTHTYCTLSLYCTYPHRILLGPLLIHAHHDLTSLLAY